MCVCVCVCVCVYKEREGDRERERKCEIERERARARERGRGGDLSRGVLVLDESFQEEEDVREEQVVRVVHQSQHHLPQPSLSNSI